MPLIFNRDNIFIDCISVILRRDLNYRTFTEMQRFTEVVEFMIYVYWLPARHASIIGTSLRVTSTQTGKKPKPGLGRVG